MGAKTCVFFVLALTVHLSQAALKLVYIESFPKGPTRISEHDFVASLDSPKPYYKATIKDLAGNDGYQLSLQPQRVEGGDVKNCFLARAADRSASPCRPNYSLRPAAGSCRVAGSESVRSASPVCDARIRGKRIITYWYLRGLAGFHAGGIAVYRNRAPAHIETSQFP